MISFNNKYIKKAGQLCYGVAVAVVGTVALSSCEKFFSQESDHVIYADNDHLNAPVDTMYSVVGIMDKMQLLADRTVLLGELRGDLVELTKYAPANVRQIFEFNVDNDNIYNTPRDYYAVINNCNYFIENADIAQKNNRNEYVFMREYAAVKAFRAWTYLQLALNYGHARYVTKPILTKQDADAEESYPLLDIPTLCDNLIADLQPLVPLYANDYPQYGSIQGVDTRLAYFPLYIMLGELNLWAGHYREAALNYYKYLSTRNGTNSAYPTGIDRLQWADGQNIPNNWRYSGAGRLSVSQYYSNNAELITMIPISNEYDSVPNPYYNQLRPLFNSRQDNDYHVSIVPSVALQNLSEAQDYCIVSVSTSQNDTVYAPHGLEDNMSGDLRLFDSWARIPNYPGVNNERVQYQLIEKHLYRNVNIWRRQMVYLRMAEALNRAGYPRFAFKILEEGVNNINIGTDVLAYYTTPSDSAYIKQFDFPQQSYTVKGQTNAYNTQGIHSRGSGDTRANQYYKFPEFASGDTLQQQIDSIEVLLVNEGALEMAFEGHRFYDLMRVALRRNDPSFLANRVARRNGTVDAALQTKLLNKDSWYINWKGKIGLGN